MLGSLVTVEQPVSGLLVSFFPDGSRRERRVAAVMQTRRLDDIRPEYSGLYLIKEQVRIQGAGGARGAGRSSKWREIRQKLNQNRRMRKKLNC